jgi:glycylpeptide N-tetradecanoyltransferase
MSTTATTKSRNNNNNNSNDKTTTTTTNNQPIEKSLANLSLNNTTTTTTTTSSTKQQQQPTNNPPNSATTTTTVPALLQPISYNRRNNNNQDDTKKDHKFWHSQPVPAAVDKAKELPIGPIDKVKTVDEVRKDPLKLPEGFNWCVLDWDDPATLDEAHTLLREHYVTDDNEMFRFDYSKDFLKWALQPPEWIPDWQIGVRQTATGKLLAMITGTPCVISACGQVMKGTEINYLCIHKKLRDKRLAPVLIKEVTRRVNLRDIWQAVYTAGVVIPTPIGSARYWHRNLNVKKLLDIGFTSLGQRQTVQRLQHLLRLPDAVEDTPGWKPAKAEHMPQIGKLLRDYLKQFTVHIEFQDEEIPHWFTPRPGVISSFVVESPEGKVTDFGSYYHLNSSVLRNPKHTSLMAAYSFYNVPGSLSLEKLFSNLLISAHAEGFDVFNALDLMQNRPVFEPLKFGTGDGDLNYYLFNFSVGGRINSNELGVVLM